MGLNVLYGNASAEELHDQWEEIEKTCEEQHKRGGDFVIDGMNNGRHIRKFVKKSQGDLFQVLHGVVVKEITRTIGSLLRKCKNNKNAGAEVMCGQKTVCTD